MDVGGGRHAGAQRRLGHERFVGDVVRGRRAWPWAWVGGERLVGSGDGAARATRQWRVATMPAVP